MRTANRSSSVLGYVAALARVVPLVLLGFALGTVSAVEGGAGSPELARHILGKRCFQKRDRLIYCPGHRIEVQAIGSYSHGSHSR